MEDRASDSDALEQAMYIEISDDSDSEHSFNKETINFAKLSRLVLFICNHAVRRLVKKCLSISKQSLYEMVHTYRASLHPVLTRQEYQQLFFAPTGKTRMDLNTDKLSFTVVYKLLVHVFNLPPHERGWGQIPRLGDKSTSACLDRILSERSAIFSHSQDGVLDDQRFEIHWENLSTAILQLEENEFANEISIYAEKIENIYKNPLDGRTRDTYIKQLQQLQEEEKDLKQFSVVLKGKMGSLKEHYEALHQDEMQMKQVISTFTGSIKDMKSTFQETIRDQTDILLSYISGRKAETVSETSASTSKVHQKGKSSHKELKEGRSSKEIFDRDTCHFDCIMNRGGVGISTAPDWLPQLYTENLKSPHRLKHYRGILAKKAIRPLEVFCIEVDATVEILEHYIIDNSTVFEVGLCDRNELDKNVSTVNIKYVYSVRVFVCEKHASICLTLCNNDCLFHNELVPFSDQLIYSNNWKIYVDLKKMYMAVFSGKALIHWHSGLDYFLNMSLFLGIGDPKDLKCSINIREFKNPASGDILDNIRNYLLHSPYISDYINCEESDNSKQGRTINSWNTSSDKCFIQRLPFLEVKACRKNKSTSCAKLGKIAGSMKSCFELQDWVSIVEKMASDLTSESNGSICAVVNIRSLVAYGVKHTYLNDSSKISPVINEKLYTTAMKSFDIFLCSSLIFHDIPFVSDFNKSNPLRVLCKCREKCFTVFIEGFLKYKIEQNRFVSKHLKLHQIVLTRNKEKNEFSIIVYLNGGQKCPLSSVNGLKILWKAFSYVNREGRILADRMKKDFENTHCDLPQIPGDIAAKLFAMHSNLTMISACPFKSKDFHVSHKVFNEPCIVLYCRSKGHIPIADAEFPVAINKTKIDVREGYCSFGIKHQLEIGQPIYVRGEPHYGPTVKGTLGGFVELPDKSNAILTCAHLFIGINDLHGKKSKLNVENKFITSDCSTPNCGKLKTLEFRHSSPRETSIDAALVEMNGSFDQCLTLSDFSQKDIDPTGTTHRVLTFEAGVSWNQIPSRYLWNPVLKYGAQSKLTCGNLHLQNGHFQIESHMVDLCEECRCVRFSSGCMHNKFRFFHQYEVYSKTNDVFFEQGDSGALVFMLGNKNDPQLHCVGMAIGMTSNNSCIVTPISDIFNALGLQGFVKSIKCQTEIPDKPSSSRESNKHDDSMSEVLTILNTMHSSINDVRASVQDVIGSVQEMKGSVQELKSDNIEIKKNIERLENRNEEENSINQPAPKRKRSDFS